MYTVHTISIINVYKKYFIFSLSLCRFLTKIIKVNQTNIIYNNKM